MLQARCRETRWCLWQEVLTENGESVVYDDCGSLTSGVDLGRHGMSNDLEREEVRETQQQGFVLYSLYTVS